MVFSMVPEAIEGGFRIMCFLRKLWRGKLGQDLIEYALMAGFVALAAGATVPSVTSSISTVFSSVASVLDEASETGGGH